MFSKLMSILYNHDLTLNFCQFWFHFGLFSVHKFGKCTQTGQVFFVTKTLRLGGSETNLPGRGVQPFCKNKTWKSIFLLKNTICGERCTAPPTVLGWKTFLWKHCHDYPGKGTDKDAQKERSKQVCGQTAWLLSIQVPSVFFLRKNMQIEPMTLSTFGKRTY